MKGEFLLGEVELFKQLKNNEIAAQKKWVNQYKREIAQFAFEYGVTTKDASEVVVRTFRQLFHQLPTIDHEGNLQSEMYKIVIQLVEKYKLSTIDEFTFPEDQLLHNEIIQLPHLEKLALICTSFTTLKTEEIEYLLNLSSDEIIVKKSEALSKITNHQIEKRLELLQKSYERIRFQIHEEAIFQQEEIEEVAFESSAVKSSKRNLYLLIAGVVMLIGMTFYSVFNSESFQQNRFENSLEKKRETYEQQRMEVLNELGLTEENIQSFGSYGLFDQQYLGGEEMRQFDRFISGIERDIEREKTVDRKKIEEEFDQLIQALQTPSDLVATLFKAPLKEDFVASEKFLEEYIKKYYMINAYYGEFISSHPEIRERLFNDEGEYLNLSTVMKEMEEIPEKVEEVIQKMSRQNIYILGYSNETDEEREVFLQQLRDALHPDVEGYITMLGLANSGYFYWTLGDELIEPHHLKEMEATLLKTNLHYENKQLLEIQYMIALTQVLGKGAPDLYDANGFVQEAYRKKWREIAGEEETPIARAIFEKVIQEFEETNWRMSKTQIYIEDNMIWDLLSNAKAENIISVDWDQRQNTDYQSVSLPNRGYDYLIDEVYDKIKQDRTVLEAHQPIVIVSSYMRALDREDREMIAILSTDDIDQERIDKHIKRWKDKKLSENKIQYLTFSRFEESANFSGADVYGSFELVREDGEWFVESYQLDHH